MRIIHAFIRCAAGSALLLAAGCDRFVSPITPLPTPPPGLRTVTGTVWQYGSNGVSRATSGSVFGWVEGPGNNRTTEAVAIGADGSYLFGAPEGATVFVTGSSYFHQPCSSRATVTGDVTLDLHNVTDPILLGANLPAALLAQPPTLSGVVYRQGVDGRVPLANATVQLNTSAGVGPIIARTRTDAAGRYVLCAVHPTPDLAVVTSLLEYETSISSRDLTGVTTMDIELRPSDFASAR